MRRSIKFANQRKKKRNLLSAEFLSFLLRIMSRISILREKKDLGEVPMTTKRENKEEKRLKNKIMKMKMTILTR